MAAKSFVDTTLSDLEKDIAARSSSQAETIPIFHEDVPPPLPLKDARYQKLPHTLVELTANNMYSAAKLYEFEKTNNSCRQDSVLDSPFGCWFDPKVEESISQLATCGQDSTEALWDTYCSSESSLSTSSPRQSLLPPSPHTIPPHLEAPSIRQHPYPPPQRPTPSTPSTEQPVPKPIFKSTSNKRSITPVELEHLRQSPLSAKLRRSHTSSPVSAMSQNCTRSVVPSFSWTSNGDSSSASQSVMSSFSNSDTVSPPPTTNSSFSAPPRDDLVVRNRSKTRKPANIIQPGCLPSTIHGRSISLPVETKSSSPIGADFDLGLPSHDFETRRQSPAPPVTDIIVSTPILTSACTTLLGTPTSASSHQPLPSPFQEQAAEISAFDSDSDDERPQPSGAALRKTISRVVLKTSRTRAETIPATNPRIIAKGASLPKRISKHDIKTPGLRFPDASENAGGCGATMVRISQASTASPVVSRTSGAASPPTALRKKVLKRESLSSRSKRTSSASKDSKRSSTSSKDTAGLIADVSIAGSKRKSSSGNRLRSWIAKVFGRRNTC